MICAKNAATLRVMNEKIRDRELEKRYRCLVHGTPEPRAGRVTLFMRKDSGENRIRVFDSPVPDGRTMITDYRVLRTDGRHSLLEVDLITGRTHQIRIHMKYIGFPLVGDYLYNPDMEYITRQALHSYRLTFLHPITGQKMDFTALLPDDMKKVLN